MRVVHAVDDTLLEGQCCTTDHEKKCNPQLNGSCSGAICSAGLAGTGLFKLGCLEEGANKVSANI